MGCGPELPLVGKSTILLRSGLLGLLTSAALLWPGQVFAQEEDANAILKSMSNYLAGQKTISANFNSNTEVLTTDLQKIQFDSSGELLLSRPDKLRASRRGGYADVEMIFDGTSLTFNAKSNMTYATLPASAWFPSSSIGYAAKSASRFRRAICCSMMSTRHFLSMSSTRSILVRASLVASTVTISPSAMPIPTGSFGWRWDPTPLRAS